MKPTKSNIPMFSDMAVLLLMRLKPGDLKKALANLDIIMPVLSKHKIKIVSNGDLEYDLDEILESEPEVEGYQ